MLCRLNDINCFYFNSKMFDVGFNLLYIMTVFCFLLFLNEIGLRYFCRGIYHKEKTLLARKRVSAKKLLEKPISYYHGMRVIFRKLCALTVNLLKSYSHISE